jgi:C1A family cysteine protease
MNARAKLVSGHRLGWRPDAPDARDLRYRAPMLRYAHTPPQVRLDQAAYMPPVYDQGNLGSCTANAIGGAVEYDLRKQGLEDFTPSRLFIYYNERVVEGDVDQDAGAMIRDGVKVLNTLGAAHETTWPYDIAQFTTKPSDAAYSEALETRATSYARVDFDRYSWRAALADTHPIVFGFTVYESFETITSDGIMPMPAPDEGVLGGHAVVAVGYDYLHMPNHGPRLYFRVRNSWGAGWGDGGYFWMPAVYATNTELCSDAWVINAVS